MKMWPVSSNSATKTSNASWLTSCGLLITWVLLHYASSIYNRIYLNKHRLTHSSKKIKRPSQQRFDCVVVVVNGKAREYSVPMPPPPIISSSWRHSSHAFASAMTITKYSDGPDQKRVNGNWSSCLKATVTGTRLIGPRCSRPMRRHC